LLRAFSMDAERRNVSLRLSARDAVVVVCVSGACAVDGTPRTRRRCYRAGDILPAAQVRRDHVAAVAARAVDGAARRLRRVPRHRVRSVRKSVAFRFIRTRSWRVRVSVRVWRKKTNRASHAHVNTRLDSRTHEYFASSNAVASMASRYSASQSAPTTVPSACAAETAKGAPARSPRLNVATAASADGGRRRRRRALARAGERDGVEALRAPDRRVQRGAHQPSARALGFAGTMARGKFSGPTSRDGRKKSSGRLRRSLLRRREPFGELVVRGRRTTPRAPIRFERAVPAETPRLARGARRARRRDTRALANARAPSGRALRAVRRLRRSVRRLGIEREAHDDCPRPRARGRLAWKTRGTLHVSHTDAEETHSQSSAPRASAASAERSAPFSKR